MTWALGHLVMLKEPHDYDPALKKWSLATLPFVPDRFELKPIDEAGSARSLRGGPPALAATPGIETHLAPHRRRP